MTKRVIRYFIDFTDGQAKWLNEMAESGWRLVKCGQLTYHFESCEPGEYMYAVEFVADKSYGKSKDYKAFLENIGYKTFYKNVNVGIYIGKVQWRPWGEGAGQIVTAPGGYQKELIIVEKKNDGKPFELHTDLTDSLRLFSKIRTSYFFTAGGMLILVAMLIFYAIWLKSVYCLLGVLACAALVMLYLHPALKISQKIRGLKEQAETNEYEAPPIREKALKLAVIIVVFIVLGVSTILAVSLSGGLVVDSYSAQSMIRSSWGNQWNATYGKLNGNMHRRVSLNAGEHTFTVEITTKSGGVGFSVTGEDGTEYYKASSIPTSTFEVIVSLTEKEKLTLRIDADEHSGSYKVNWE